MHKVYNNNCSAEALTDYLLHGSCWAVLNAHHQCTLSTISIALLLLAIAKFFFASLPSLLHKVELVITV